MTNAQHMLWMLDEYETIQVARYPGFITGKPVGMGGSLGRKEATGYGVVFTIREALKELGIDPSVFEKQTLHIHVPAGATPKDGPSAGVTMATAVA